MWIQVKSLDLTGLRSISLRKERENFSILMESLQAVILEHLLVFWTTILAAGSLMTLQSITSKVCDHHRLYFSLFRCRNISMNSIVYRFSKNKPRNDFLVKQFIPPRKIRPIKEYENYTYLCEGSLEDELQQPQSFTYIPANTERAINLFMARKPKSLVGFHFTVFSSRKKRMVSNRISEGLSSSTSTA